MSTYKEIRIWDFPPTLTYIRLNDGFRLNLFNKLLSFTGSYQKLSDLTTNLSLSYGIRRSSSAGNLYGWVKGNKSDCGKVKPINIPLWALIEFSKILSGSKENYNDVMKEIEENIECYTGRGKSNPIIRSKLPLYLTPEMVSIIFHFLGDGHIGKKGVYSSYRQMNVKGLENFLLKLRSVFGDFNYNRNEFNNGKVIVPKIMTHFYNHYFKLPNTDTFESYVPDKIKSLNKEFLVASLVAFMIDEANIGEIIEIYSKNPRLITGIREIAIKCGYACMEVRRKYRYGIFDSYRFLISSRSYLELHKDILKLTEKFPLCGLAHKTKKLEILVKRKQRGTLKEKRGITKNKILDILAIKPNTISELSELLNIGNSSIREHLWELEKSFKITRKGRLGRNVLWSTN